MYNAFSNTFVLDSFFLLGVDFHCVKWIRRYKLMIWYQLVLQDKSLIWEWYRIYLEVPAGT